MNTEITYEKFFNSEFWQGATTEDLTDAIKHGADIHARNSLHRTPMHFAAGHSKSGDVIELLIEKEIDISACDLFDITPLHFAAAHNETLDVVEKLLDKVKDTHKNSYRTRDFPSKGGLTPLHWAVRSSKALEVIRLFLEHEANSNAEDKFNNTPLHYAARSFRASAEVIKLLIVHEANPDCMNIFQKTPVDYINKNRHLTREKKQNLLKTLEDYDPILDQYYCGELEGTSSNGHFHPKE